MIGTQSSFSDASWKSILEKTVIESSHGSDIFSAQEVLPMLSFLYSVNNTKDLKRLIKKHKTAFSPISLCLNNNTLLLLVQVSTVVNGRTISQVVEEVKGCQEENKDNEDTKSTRSEGAAEQIQQHLRDRLVVDVVWIDIDICSIDNSTT